MKISPKSLIIKLLLNVPRLIGILKSSNAISFGCQKKPWAQFLPQPSAPGLVVPLRRRGQKPLASLHFPKGRRVAIRNSPFVFRLWSASWDSDCRTKPSLTGLIGGLEHFVLFFHFIIKGCHPKPIDEFSIIFQDGHIAPPTSGCLFTKRYLISIVTATFPYFFWDPTSPLAGACPKLCYGIWGMVIQTSFKALLIRGKVIESCYKQILRFSREVGKDTAGGRS